MQNIKVLPDNVINLVAAGEVVERPCSVVKELVENSIDAGATKIEIEIKNGGKKLICVKDNGNGIPKCDVKTAFMRHATNKISTETDLEKIITLGFRGEALSSICAVARVKIFTSFEKDEMGTYYEIEGGKEILVSDCAPFKGTSISVLDLFFNTPARIKFLKKDATEGNLINSIVDHLALSHPEISFKFTKENKIVFQTPGDGKLSSVISRIFGTDFFKSLLEIDYSWNNIKITGFISNPLISNSSAKIQNFFVNGRWVKDKIISNAIEIALRDECQNVKVSSFIYLSIPTEAVDVNVHPNKTEVRFENEKIIFESMYNAIRNCMQKKRNNDIEKIENKVASKNEVKTSEIRNFARKKIVPSMVEERTLNVFNNLKKKSTLNDTVVIPKYSFKKNEKKSPIENFPVKKFNILNNFCDAKKNENVVIDFYECEKTKIIGEIFECFIIVQRKNEVLFIDKHAAHERLIFEKLSKSDYKKSSQMLVSSVVVNFSKEEYDCLIDNLNLVNEIGYSLEDFGYGKILVRGIPMYMDSKNVKDSLFEISNFLFKNKSTNLNELKKFYAKIACKSSIKAGMISSKKEIEFLVQSVFDSDVASCPHGRPIYFNVTKDQIYKKFLRK